MKTTIAKSLVVGLAAAAALTACGGGGGSDTATPAANPTAPAPVAIVVTAALASYPAGSEEENAYNLLNAERGRCGFGLLSQAAALDRSAKAHAQYLTTNGFQYGHTEAPNLPYFTGAQELNRAKVAGYSNFTQVGADLAVNSGPVGPAGLLRTTKQLKALLSVPYHLLSLTDPFSEVGIGFSQTQAPYSGSTLEKIALNISMGRNDGVNDLASEQITSYPCEGSTGVSPGLGEETPSGIPVNLTQDFRSYGSAIAVKVQMGKVLNLTNATVTPSSGPAIQTVIVSQTNDPQKGAYMRSDSSYILPLTPLKADTAYRVDLTGTNNGALFSKSFSFTTSR